MFVETRKLLRNPSSLSGENNEMLTTLSTRIRTVSELAPIGSRHALADVWRLVQGE